MKYEQLDPDYKYDVIAEAIYAREMEFFHYEFDLINFKYIVSRLSYGSSYRDEIDKRRLETEIQMGRVELVIAALKAQIDDQEKYEAAVKRAMIARSKKNGKGNADLDG